jgi:hypothetical protein
MLRKSCGEGRVENGLAFEMSYSDVVFIAVTPHQDDVLSELHTSSESIQNCTIHTSTYNTGDALIW